MLKARVLQKYLDAFETGFYALLSAHHVAMQIFDVAICEQAYEYINIDLDQVRL